MVQLLAVLSALVESQTAVLAFQLAELQALRLRTEKANCRVVELRQVIQTGLATSERVTSARRVTPGMLFDLRQSRERVEAAVAELETLSEEFEAIDHASNLLIAHQVLAQVFPAPMADA